MSGYIELERKRAVTPEQAESRHIVMQLESILTCPACRHQAAETMPTDACRFFYDCKGCGARLKPRAGDCCVFCSYGSVPCPPVQANGKCC
jgi:transcription elongation factor Elf1